MGYNQDAWRMVEEKVKAEVAAGVAEEVATKVAAAIAEQLPTAIAAALAPGETIAAAIANAIAGHEAKAEGDTFANSHVVGAAS